MPGIDFVSEPLRLSLQRAVCIELAASRRSSLDEYEPSLPRRQPRQQVIDGPHPVQNALRVVEALDPDGDPYFWRQRKLLPDGVPAVLDRGLCRQRGRRPLDRDRIRPDHGLTAAERDGGLLAIDPALHETISRLEEVVAVELRMKAENRAAQQSIHDLLAPGADAERLGVRPGDVPERQDGGAGQPLAYHPRQKRKVIVVNEHDRVFVRRLLDDRIGEALVDRHVLLPVLLAEGRAHEGDMAQRPEPFVRKSIVVALLLLLAQPDASQRVGRVVRRDADVIALIDRLPIGRTAAMGDPRAAARAHDRFEGRHKAARGNLERDRAVVTIVDVGLAV